MRPRPGGRKLEPSAAKASPSPEFASPFTPDRLIAHAHAPLQLLARLSGLTTVRDPGTLREAASAAVAGFETSATAAGIASDQVRRGHYALCESLDVAVQNTPWGVDSAWARRTLVATFHPQIGPGRFSDVLRAAETRSEKLAPVLELMLLCLSLGVPDEAARRRAAAVLLEHAPPAAPLSPHWQGADIPIRAHPSPKLPVWVAATIALAVATGAYLFLRTQTDVAGDTLFTAMIDAPPAHMPQITREPAPPLPPPPPPQEPTARDRLQSRLGAEEGVAIVGTPGAPILRLADKDLFAREGAILQPGGAALIAHVAAALGSEGGSLDVIGYSDDRPVRTVAFASAFKLSSARAESVRAALAKALPSLHLAAEGRGAADPVAPNATEAGRDANRRVDLVLMPSAP